MKKIITVKYLLKRLENINVKLISGQDGSDKNIEYINIQEFALKSDRIKKHGVLLTTFASFSDSQKIIEHLQWLLSKEIHSVGIHSVFIKKIPEEVILFSNANNLPLFLIPEEVSYQQIMQVYFQLLVEDTNNKRVHLEQINIKMLRSVALDRGSQYIVSILGKHLNQQIIHLDKLLQLKSLWTDNDFDKEEIQNIGHKLTAEQKAFSSEESIFEYRSNSGNRSIFSFRVIPIMDNMNFYGLLLIGCNNDFSVSDESLINHGKTALLLDSIKRNTMEKYLKNNDMKIIESILESPSKKKTGDFFDLSLYMKDVNLIYLIDFNDTSNLHKSFEYIHQKISKWNPHSLIWMFNSQIICVVNNDIPTHLLNRISELFEDIIIGVSDKSKNTTAESILEKYEQAQLGVKIGGTKGKKINYWTDLGYDKFLYALHQNDILKSAALNLLQPLIEHDATSNSELLITLSVYLDNFFSIKKSAEDLYIHKNTVKYRINKTKELYKDINFEDPETFLLFSSALRLYRILET